MENNFKVGDLVQFKNDQLKDKFTVGKNYVVLAISNIRGSEYVVVQNDVGVKQSLFPWRFIGGEAPMKKEISVGVTVVALKDVGFSAKKGELYRVQGVKEDYVKLHGIGNWMRIDAFSVSDKPAIIVKDGDKLLKELADKVNANGVGTCSYVLEFECGHKEWHIVDMCHARLNNYTNPDKEVKHVALNVSGHYKEASDKEAYKAHVQYIMQESPFKECFIPRNVEDILKDGVLLNIDKTYSHCVAAAIALRSGSEFPNITALFKEAVDAGFSGNVATILSVFFRKKENGNLEFTPFGGGHHYIHSGMKMEDVIKFFEKGFHIDKKEKSYKEGCTAGFRVFDSIAKQDKETVSAFITKMKGVEMKKMDGYWSPLPTFVGKNALVKAGAALCKYF